MTTTYETYLVRYTTDDGESGEVARQGIDSALHLARRMSAGNGTASVSLMHHHPEDGWQVDVEPVALAWRGRVYMAAEASDDVPAVEVAEALAFVADEATLACALRRRMNLSSDVRLIDLATVPDNERATYEAILAEWEEACGM